MAPNQKRKRGDRTYSQDSNDGSNRPSPHRPQNLHLAQQNQHNSPQSGRGGRRGSGSRGGGGRNGGPPPQSPVNGQSGQPTSVRVSPATNSAMAPPSSNTSQPRTTAAPNNHSQSTAPAEQRTAQPAKPPRPPPRPYDYKCLTDERIASWQTLSRKAVIDNAVQLHAQGDVMALSAIFQELLRAGQDGRLDAEDAGAVVKDILESSTAPDGLDPVSFFLDCLSVLTESDASHPLLKVVLVSTGISPLRMRGELDEALLTTLGMVRSTFWRVKVRSGTNDLYRQQSYNLLREESEGYSKLVTEYFSTTFSGPAYGPSVPAETFQRVKGLIGAFDLDVGRVLDVTLDVFANLLVKHYRFFIKFLRESSWWPDTESVGDGLVTEYQGLDPLPKWALPGSAVWHTSETEKEQKAEIKAEQDRIFWDRARTVGMDAFFELGRRRVLEDQRTKDESDEIRAQNNPLELWRQRWLDETKTIPPSGNRIAAQLLGFKLRFYASPIRDPQDVLPDNLIYLAALLIKIGFISLVDLYPHLYPPDEDMPALRERLMKEKQEKEKKNRPGGGSNALSMAGALADDTLPPPPRIREPENRGTPSRADPAAVDKAATPKPEEEEVEEVLPEPADQKAQLLRSLLCIGAIPEALYILGKFPWLLDVYSDLPEYIHRILHHSLSQVYEASQPLAGHVGLRAEKQPLTEQPGLPKGHFRLGENPPRKTLRWAQLDKENAHDGNDYRFYWDDWADNVPICQTVDDVFVLCDTFLNLSGLKIGRDPLLLMKLARIGKRSLSEDSSENNFARWIDLSKRLLVPALSLTRANPGVVNEVFELLKFFPVKTRYSIYAEWYTGPTSRLPDIKAAFTQADYETKHLFRLITNKNIKQMARALAKITCASPGVIFSVAIRQIESYNNLIEVFVECGRYFTYLAYDVLTWSLVKSLGGRDRDRVQADGMLTSSWLKALSLLAGKIFKRYSVMNPTPILQYVAYQLYNGNSTDLEVLDQTVKNMAGIRADMVFNEAQTQAMAGGPTLQTQTLKQLHDRRQETQSASSRLIKALTASGLAGQLLILIAQERQRFPFSDTVSDAPLKVLGNNLDRIHEIFMQYLDMLRSNLPIREFEAAVPDVVSLMSEFGVEASIAFSVSRPSINNAMANVDTISRPEKKDKRRGSGNDQLLTNGDVDMADEDVKIELDQVVNGTSADIAEKAATPQKAEDAENVDMEDAGMILENHSSLKAPTPTITAAGPEEPWHPALKPLMDRLKPVLREDFEATIPLSFYVTFWQLSLNDMLVPTSGYEDEIKRQKSRMDTINADRTDMTVAGAKKKDQERKRILELIDRLRAEMKAQVTAYTLIRGRLQKERLHWFVNHMKVKKEDVNAALLQECFLPRILLSPLDALFAFKMLFFLHSSGTPGFYTMHFINRFMDEKAITAVIFQCTAREADSLGRFLNELFKELKKWHTDSATYEKLAYGMKKDLPGFARKFTPDMKPDVLLPFEDFRTLLYKWHRALHSALKACLNGGEYMHMRNAMIVLKAMHQQFPVVNFMGNQILTIVSEMGDPDNKSEMRQDLKLTAQSLVAHLKRREKEWVIPQAFHRVSGLADQDESIRTKSTKSEKPPESQRSASRAGSARPNTPQPPSSGTQKSLDPAAAESKPRPTPLSNDVRKPSTTGKEVEDGEIEDAKKTDSKEQQAVPSTTAATTAKSQSEGASTPSTQSLDQKTPAAAPAATPASSGPPTAAAAVQPAARPTPQTTGPRPETPTPAPAAHHGVPLRPEISRTPSTQPRDSHALPNRPEARPSQGRMPPRLHDRPADYASHRDGRGPANPDYGRLDRPSDMARANTGERREQSPGRRSRARTPERLPPTSRDHREPAYGGSRDQRGYPEDRGPRPPPRDARPTDRNGNWTNAPRDRPNADSQNHQPSIDSRHRLNGDHATTAPVSAPTHPDRAGLINPERAALIEQQQPDRPSYNPPQHDRPPPNLDRVAMNPERAALFNEEFGHRSDHRPERDGRGSRGSRPSSRPHSPRRADDRPPSNLPPRFDGARDDRRDGRMPLSDRPPTSAGPPYSRDRREESSSHPPTGPRGDRPGRGDLPESGPSHRSRELFQPSASSGSPVDPNHGRLTQDFGPPPRSQDPNYGRLNSNPDIPSGPRGRNQGGRGGRNFTGPAMHGNSRPDGPSHNQIPPSPSQDRPPPQGPPSDHRDRRDPASFNQTRPQAASTSQPPAAEQGPADMAGIHPSRLNQINPPLLNVNIPPSSAPPHQPSSAASPFPPSGPRGPHRGGPNPNTLPSPSSRNPPTGPSSAPQDRRQQEDKRFAGLQTVLQQGGPGAPVPFDRNGNNDRGASIRGRANRPQGMDAPASGPGTPDFGRGDGPPRRFEGAGVPDTGTQDERPDSRNSRRHEGDRRGGGRHRDERSRSPRGRERRPEEYREKRGGGTREGSGRGGRDDGRDSGRERDGPPRERERRDGGRGRDDQMMPRREQLPMEQQPHQHQQHPPQQQPPMRRGGPPVEEPMHWGNGDARMRGPPERRDERERRGGDGRDMGRDGRKRGRPGDEGPHGDSKRSRRNQ